MTPNMKFTFDFFKKRKTSEFLPLTLKISSYKSQSKAQFNLQSLGDNKTGYRAENIIVSTDENFKKCSRLFTLLSYTLLKIYCYAKQ